MSGIVEKVSKAEFAVPHRHTIILIKCLREICDDVVDMLCTD